MKKNLCFAAIMLVLLNVKAQNLQRHNYNDGRVLVYIEQRGHQTAVCNPRNNDKHDRLQIQNISSGTITVKYSYREVRYNCDDIFQMERVKYDELTLSSGQSTYKSSMLSNGKIGYSYIESFSVINVSESGSKTQRAKINRVTRKSLTVPSWAQGTWSNTFNPNYCIIITSSHMGDNHSNNPTAVHRIQGDDIFFSNDGTSGFTISRKNLPPNQLNFFNINLEPILFIKIR